MPSCKGTPKQHGKFLEKCELNGDSFRTCIRKLETKFKDSRKKPHRKKSYKKKSRGKKKDTKKKTS